MSNIKEEVVEFKC